MHIFRKKEFYVRTIATFLLIVLIDWFMEGGLQLFKRNTFSQTIENDKIPITHISIAAALVYFQLKKEVSKSNPLCVSIRRF
jgi:hypothetical protein